MDATFIQSRIDATKSQIESYENAALALSTGGIQSYTFDTGQGRQTITKLEVRSLQITIDQLYSRLSSLEARLFGGSVTGVPVW
jgi:hypothetical protein